MEKEQYEIMYNIEKDNWWYKGMRKISFALIDKFIKTRDNKILDAWCGTGIKFYNPQYLYRIQKNIEWG